MAIDPPPRLFRRHSCSVLLVHLVWTTWRRAPVLVTSLDVALARFLDGKMRELGGALVAVGNASDHVHVLARYPATLRLAELVQRLKGSSSYAWNASGRAARPSLAWQAGYWAESVSPRDVPMLASYVAGQRAHHGDATAPETWEASLGNDDASPKGFPTSQP